MFKLAVLLAVVAVAHARPGGYLATGGIYNPDRELDYMEEARSAGKFAWSHKFEQEQAAEQTEEADRGARQAAAYIPTFFTAPAHHAALTAARPQVVQFNQAQRTQPLYYQQYKQ